MGVCITGGSCQSGVAVGRGLGVAVGLGLGVDWGLGFAVAWGLGATALPCWPYQKPLAARARCSASTSLPAWPNFSERVDVRPSARRVWGPATPSTLRPRACWNALTAAIVRGP
ncbi:hypothetical protein D3C72_719460 [compost metagenome]